MYCFVSYSFTLGTDNSNNNVCTYSFTLGTDTSNRTMYAFTISVLFTIVCFVQSAFCYTLEIQLCTLYYSELKTTEELPKHFFNPLTPRSNF